MLHGELSEGRLIVKFSRNAQAQAEQARGTKRSSGWGKALCGAENFYPVWFA
jgi:hypothetical protein